MLKHIKSHKTVLTYTLAAGIICLAVFAIPVSWLRIAASSGGIVEKPADDAVLSPSATNGKILFSSGRAPGSPTNLKVHTMNADGSDVTCLMCGTGDTRIGRLPAISPDGSTIAYVDTASPTSIHLMNADGTNDRILTTGSSPAWSPQSDRILFTRNIATPTPHNELFIISTNGSGEAPLNDSPTHNNVLPTWSVVSPAFPEGRIAFRSSRDGNSEIYIIAPTAGQNFQDAPQVNVTNNPATDSDPAWSPDGTKLAFQSDRFQTGALAEMYTMEMNPNPGTITRLTNDGPSPGGFQDSSPVWSPDGTKIAYVSFRGNFEIIVINAATGAPVEPPVGGNITNNAAIDFDVDWAAGAANTRVIRAVDVSGTAGQQVVVSFELVSSGDEAAASFTVNFDKDKLSNPVATIGNGAPSGAQVGTNISQVTSGKVGVLVDSVTAFTAGTRQLLTIRFNVASNAAAGTTPITFGTTPTAQSVTNTLGGLLPTTYTPGNVTIAAATATNGKIAYQQGGRATSNIYTITPGSGISTGLRRGFHPAYSPDGSKIAFTDNTAGPTDGFLMLMDANGSNVRQLATPRQGFTPTWSPNGQRLAFIRGDFNSVGDNGKGQIYVIDMTPGSEGANEVLIPTGTRSISKPAWGSTNRIVAACYDPFGTSGTDPKGVCVTGPIPASQDIAANPPTFTLISGQNTNDREATWSPDGSKVAFISTRDYPMFNASEIYSANPDGSSPTRLSNTVDFKSQPTWSPDGTKIAYSRGGSQGSTNAVLRSVNADGSNATTPAIITNFGSGDVFPNWGALATTPTPTPTPTLTPTPTPTATPTPTPAPTPTPTPVPRRLRLGGSGAGPFTLRPGQTYSIGVSLDGQRNERAISFSVNVNPTVMKIKRVRFGGGFLDLEFPRAGDTIQVNETQLDIGRVGVLLELAPDIFSSVQLAAIDIEILPTAVPGIYPISFGGSPVVQSVASSTGALLPTVYQDNSLAIASGCRYSLSADSQNFLTQGGTGSFTATRVDGVGACEWNAVVAPTADPFVTVTTPAGAGTSTINFTVRPNTTAFGRQAKIDFINDAGIRIPFTVGQTSASSACTYFVSPASRDIRINGDGGFIQITAPPGCQWTATTDANWITLTGLPSGTGSGSIFYIVNSNDGNPGDTRFRSGTVNIAGQTHVVNQKGNDCPLGIILERGERGQTSEPSSTAGSVDLDMFRAFRDEVLDESSFGKNFTRQYYQHAGEISRTLIFNPSLLFRLREGVERYGAVSESVLRRKRAVADLNRGEAVDTAALELPVVTDSEIAEVDGLLGDISDLSSDSLKHDLQEVRAAIQDPRVHEEFGIRVERGERRPLPNERASGTLGIFSRIVELGDRLTSLISSKPAQTADRGNAPAEGEPSPTPSIDRYGAIPLSFEINRGQVDSQVKFLSRGPGYNLFLTPNEAVMELNRTRLANSSDLSETGTLRMTLDGANSSPRVRGREKLASKTNYLVGSDRKAWKTGVEHYAKVEYENVYPGTDLVYYGNQRQLEYDFVVAPGSDPKNIKMKFTGADQISVDHDGSLILRTGERETRMLAPYSYQTIGGIKREVVSRYVIDPGKAVDGRQDGLPTVGFEVGAYDAHRSLVIDPILVYSSFLGGSGEDTPTSVTVDSAGNTYMIGYTDSTNFPLAGALQPSYGGDPQDIFVSKLNAAGTALVYSTYIGGSGQDNGSDIAVDNNGNVYFTGYTGSTNFPTVNAVQNGLTGYNNAIVAKLDPSGSQLLYSTYFGGSIGEFGSAIAVDAAGNAYVGGVTSSPDFPKVNAIQQFYGGDLADAFVAKFNPSGSQVLYSSFLGGTGNEGVNGIAVDTSGNAYISGVTFSGNFPTTNAPHQANFRGGSFDAFLTKINPAGTALSYSTYLGGSGDDRGYRIALDGTGNIYVAGQTSSFDFQTASAFQSNYGGGPSDAFITKFNPAFSIGYSTYLGGVGTDGATGFAVSPAGNAYVTGFTGSPNFPLVLPNQAAFGGGTQPDAFVSKLNTAGTALDFSTFLGGSGFDTGFDIAIDPVGSAYIFGNTSSANFPTVSPFQPAYAGGVTDLFVAKLAEGTTLSGRVLTPSGQALRNAVVSLITPAGQRRTATTSSFGLFSFSDVPNGATYTVSVASKRYRFAPRIISVTGNANLGDLIGLE